MAHTKATVILLMVLISFTCAQMDKKTTTETPIDPTSSSTSSSTVTPKTSTSTTTPEPSTNTTTPIPTSTVPPTTSTTPTTPTTPQPTPSPEPTPPDFKKWSYTDDKNQTCVIVQLALQINLTYVTADSKASNVLYNVPVNRTTVSGGSCEKNTQSITVQWGQEKESKMKLQFTQNATALEFTLSEVYLSINVSGEIVNAKANQTIELYHVRNDFATPLDMSYHCNKLQTIEFANSKDSNNTFANATVSHLQLEAFHTKNTDQFATARDCEAIDTPDIVPIAVGCALAALVVVVLIAYLIGRRRAQARGYLSM